MNLVDDSLIKDTMAVGAVMSAIRRPLAQDMTIGQEMGADLSSPRLGMEPRAALLGETAPARAAE